MSQHRLAAPDIERIFRGETVSGLSEWQLLARYLEDRDEIAFEALVARHGPMVMGTCRRMLAGQADIEDAFQATFLVLVRRARSLGPRDAIGPWLHGVAARVSLRARSQAARRRQVEAIAREVTAGHAGSSQVDGELAAILDQEVHRLPAKYRSPIILCYLQGRTHEEAARQLNWALGTVKGRLARARDLLRSRLLRRGIAPSMAVMGAALARDASAAIDREFLEHTVQTCMKVTLGHASIDAVSISIASLVKGALTSMILDKLKWAGVAVAASGLAFTGAVVLARQDAKIAEQGPARAAVTTVIDRADTRATAKTDIVSDPEVANGSTELNDLRDRLVMAARREWTTSLDEFRRNQASLDRTYQASRRLMDAEEQVNTPGSDRAAAEGHLDRMRQIARIQGANPPRSESQTAQVGALAAEAELWLARASARPSTGGKSQNTTRAADASRRVRESEKGPDAPGVIGPLRYSDDARSRQIIAKLEQMVLMRFPDETPIDEVIKHIKDSTKSSEMPSGLPVYVDPLGLQEAEKSLTSTIVMDLEGVPLRRTLQLALAQINLVYFVEDGIVFITSEDSAKSPLPPAAPSRTPLTERFERAARGELTVDEMKDLVEMVKTQSLIREIREAEKKGEAGPIWGGEGPDPALAIDQAKQNKELVESLIKEMRSLIEALKAERISNPAEKPVDRSERRRIQ